eukprot:241771-Pyramimonas_sp.AAC.1
MTMAVIYLIWQMRQIRASLRQPQEIERMPRLVREDDDRTRGSTPTAATGAAARTRTPEKVE